MPRHKNPVNFEPDAKKKVIFDRYNKIKLIPVRHTEMKSLSTTHTATKFISSYTRIKSSSIPTLKPSQFGPPTQNSIKSLVFSVSTLILNTSDFRPAFENQVNFDHPHNNEINVITTLKSSQT